MKVYVLQVDRFKLILGIDAFKNAFMHQQFERKLVQGPFQNLQVQDLS